MKGQSNTIESINTFWGIHFFVVVTPTLYLMNFFCFRPIFHLSFIDSFAVILIIQAVLSDIGYRLTVEYQRNYKTILADTIIIQGGYICYACFERYGRMIRVMVLLVSIWILFLAVLIFAQKVPSSLDKKRRGKVVKIRLRKWHLKTRNAYAVGMLLLIFLIVCRSIHDSTAYRMANFGKIQTIHTIKQEDQEKREALLEEILSVIATDRWETLPLNEKQEICKDVIMLEAYELGIRKNIHVSFHNLNDEADEHYSEDGAFYCERKVIVLNESAFARWDMDEMLLTALHEIRHYYQYLLCQVYWSTGEYYQDLQYYEKIENYADNFSNYIQAKDGDFDDYENQLIEQDARDYAKSRLSYYEQQARMFENGLIPEKNVIQ